MMSDRENLLAQKMRDLQIHRHEIELKKLRASPGDQLATSFLRALEAALAAARCRWALNVSLAGALRCSARTNCLQNSRSK